jgi:SNF2 family DNA or RNA helicase
MIIQARNRLWRVDSVTAKTATGTSIDNPNLASRIFFVPLEGKGMRVAAMDYPPATAGDAALHDLFLRATRITMMHSTAPLASLQRSRVIPTNYQLVPVMMALDMPRVRLLIADDVGLGKTIEAGLIAVELLARKQAERVLVLTPANLKEQWREALLHFFHLEFEPLSSTEIRKVGKRLPPGANPWAHFPFVIASIDYAKQDSVKNLILSQRWDLVIVDEAHGAGAPIAGSRTTATKERYEFVRDLAHRCEHLILATATPHNGYTASFASLLRMLDETLTSHNHITYPLGLVDGDLTSPIIRRQRAARHVIQRRRQDVQAWFERENKRSPFPERNSQEIFIEPSKAELEVYRAFQNYQRFVFAGRESKDVHVLARWLVMHFLRRATSSPYALRRSLENRIGRLKDRLDQPQEEEERISTPVEQALKGATVDAGDTDLFSEEELDDKLDKLDIVRRAELRSEIGFLEEVLSAVRNWRIEADTKLKSLKRLLNDYGHLGRYPHTIIFTRYVDTMEYLARELAKEEGFKIFTIEGSLSEKARAERIHAFQHAERALLVATDAISEGLNLQFAANQLVHYELPWNPNRLEQRNGRIDRFKQPEEEVRIRTLINERSFDVVVFRRLIEKAQRIREAYGFLPSYFSDEKYTEELVMELIDESLTEQRFMQPGLFAHAAEQEISPKDRAIAERMKEESFYGQSAFNLPDVEDRLKRSQETIGSPQEVERLVIASFRYLDWRVHDHKDGSYTVSRGGAEPIAGIGDELGRITFDADVGALHPEVEHLDIAHPVVSKLLAYIKRQTYLGLRDARTAAISKTLPSGMPAHAVFHVRARFTVGEKGRGQLIEALVPIGINLMTGELAPEETVKVLLQGEWRQAGFAPNLIDNLLQKARNLPDLNALIEKAVRAEAERLRAERQQLRARLEEAYPSQSAWLIGIDAVEPATHDVLALTVVIPARKD